MSLNGLDVPEIQAAYEAVITEAGGWFLLKYVSRDEIALLGKGKQGVSEARNAIIAYEEPSPLYGLIIYRRRKVLIKYLPAGTSRLLQARTTVHFQDVVERFSPYETLLQIATGEALNDTSLASSFPLHTATASPSNSRLHEISEDAEDPGPAPRPTPMKSATPTSKYSSGRFKPDRRSEAASKTERPLPGTQVSNNSLYVPSESSSSPTTPIKPSLSQFLVRDESGQTSVTSLESPLSIASPANSVTSEASSKTEVSSARTSHTPRNEHTSLHSISGAAKAGPLPDLPGKSQEETSTPTDPRERSLPELPRESRTQQRPVKDSSEPGEVSPKYEEDYDFSKFDALFKPKVKLGPRPVVAGEQPTTSRVSGLPPNLRHSVKKQELSRAHTFPEQKPVTPATVAALPTFPAPPPIPNLPEYQPRPVSRGSIKSLPSQKSTGMTADKLRLMKAVELRKKQMRKSNPQENFRPPLEETAPAVPPLPTTPAAPKASDPSSSMTDSEPSAVSILPAVPARSPMREMKKGILDIAIANRIEQAQPYKADSGIGMQYDNSAKTEVNSTAGPPKAESSAAMNNHAHQPQQAPFGVQSDARGIDDEGNSKSEPSEDTPVDAAQTPTLAMSALEDVFHGGSAVVADVVVPTIVMADGSRPDTSSYEYFKDQETATDTHEDDHAREDHAEDQEVEESLVQSPMQQHIAKRRRGFVEPLQLPASNSGNPDDFGSDDEDFYEELQSATFQQARPMTMSKSPTFMEFPRRPSATSDAAPSETDMSVRSISIPKAASPAEKASELSDLLSPEVTKQPQTYTPSGAIPVDKLEALASYNRNVSSGISRRIQALAENSQRDSASSGHIVPTRPLTPETSPNTFLQTDHRERQASMRGRHARPPSYRRNSQRTSIAQPTLPAASQENAPVLSFQHDPVTNRNSVSVTARIVRPAAFQEVESIEPRLDPDAQLSQIVEPSDLNESLPRLNTSRPSTGLGSSHSMDSSANSPVMSPSSYDRPLYSAARFGRQKTLTPSTPSADDFPAPPPPPSSNRDTLTSVDEAASSSQGSSSRTSRFFKRMSNLSNAATGKRRGSQKKSLDSSHENQGGMASRIWNRASTSLQQQPEKAVTERTGAEQTPQADTPPACVVGDLNVQFPEALLWKRRMVTIDDAGYLQFSIAQALDVHRAVAVRRHHMSEFKQPYLPDAEQQELPHSVFLEFSAAVSPELAGTTIQTACEDVLAHRQVMHMLRSYWKAWAGAV